MVILSSLSSQTTFFLASDIAEAECYMKTSLLDNSHYRRKTVLRTSNESLDYEHNKVELRQQIFARHFQRNMLAIFYYY